MDYLQEGINLRAMGQRDPLTEWQREGYDMFGQMMGGIAEDFVKYVMHVQVVEEAKESTALADAVYSAPDESAAGGGAGMAAAAKVQAQVEGRGDAVPDDVPEDEVVTTPVVKSEWDKPPRNAPCPCGSGKKFKNCHGAA